MKKIKFVEVSIVIAILYNVFWILLGAYYVYPTAEDLGLAALSRDTGIIKAALNTLNTLDGRYTTNILHGINPLAFNWYYGYKLMPIITLVLFSFSMFVFFNNYFINKSKLENGIFSTGLVIVFFSLLNLSTTLYWMITSFVYLYPIIFFLFFYSFYLNYFKKEKEYQLMLGHFFLFLLLGCSELYLISIGLFLSYQLYIHYSNPKFRNIILFYLLIYIASSFLFVSSPGIYNRLVTYEQQREAFYSNILGSIFELTFLVFKQLFSFTFLTFLLLFISRYKKNYNHPKILVFVLVFTFFLMKIVLINLVGVGEIPIRTLSAFLPILILTILIFLSKWDAIYRRYEIAITVIFLLSFLFEKNSINEIRSDYFSGKLETYKNIMDENYQALNVSKEEDCIKVVILKDIASFIPRSIAADPIIVPNRFYPQWNSAYEKYFKVDEIRLENDTIPLLIDAVYEIRN